MSLNNTYWMSRAFVAMGFKNNYPGNETVHRGQWLKDGRTLFDFNLERFIVFHRDLGPRSGYMVAYRLNQIFRRMGKAHQAWSENGNVVISCNCKVVGRIPKGYSWTLMLRRSPSRLV